MFTVIFMVIACSTQARNPFFSTRAFQDVQKKMAQAKMEAENAKRSAENDKKSAPDAKSRMEASTKIEKISAEINTLALAEAYIKDGKAPPERLQEINEVVVRLTRSVWVMCQGAPWMSDDAKTNFGPILESNLDKIRQLTRSVGMVTSNDINPATHAIVRSRGVVGTAIAVGRRQVITNKHVIIEGRLGFEDIANDSALKLYSTIGASVEFPVEYAGCVPSPITAKTRVMIESIDYVDPILDFVVARVSGDLGSFVTFPSTHDFTPGDRVAVIGYPTRPGDSEGFWTPTQIDQVFRTPDGRTPFPYQRLAEGFSLPDSTDLESGYFRYDATTWGGNSGSLVVSLFTGAIIGLHARGLQSRTDNDGYNEAIDSEKINAAISLANVLVASHVTH